LLSIEKDVAVPVAHGRELRVPLSSGNGVCFVLFDDLCRKEVRACVRALLMLLCCVRPLPHPLLLLLY
jgi:hypothetical protein